MKHLFLLAASSLLAQQTAVRALDQAARHLDEIGRIATGMVDGDVCQRIVHKASLAEMFSDNPRDKFAAPDNYNVDQVSFVLIKKTLLRLARLAPLTCDVNLWMPLPQQPGKIHIVIRNQNELSQFWPWGTLFQDATPAMKTVLETGKRVTVRDRPGWVSVLAPVYNSLGEIAGLVEVVTHQRLLSE
jgi:hypothetical protein